MRFFSLWKLIDEFELLFFFNCLSLASYGSVIDTMFRVDSGLGTNTEGTELTSSWPDSCAWGGGSSVLDCN